jgi:hypothetical protein
MWNGSLPRSGRGWGLTILGPFVIGTVGAIVLLLSLLLLLRIGTSIDWLGTMFEYEKLLLASEIHTTCSSKQPS